MRPRIVWQGAPEEGIHNIEQLVWNDLERAFPDCEDWTNIIFHHVFLDGDTGGDGPVVMLTGGADKDAVVCTYYGNPEWKTTPMDKDTFENLARQGVPITEGAELQSLRKREN